MEYIVHEGMIQSWPGFSYLNFHFSLKDELMRKDIQICHNPIFLSCPDFACWSILRNIWKLHLFFDWELYMFHRHMLVYFNFYILLKIILVFSCFYNFSLNRKWLLKKPTTFATEWKIECYVARVKEELNGLFPQIFNWVTSLRIKVLKVNPQFIACVDQTSVFKVLFEWQLTATSWSSDYFTWNHLMDHT